MNFELLEDDYRRLQAKVSLKANGTQGGVFNLKLTNVPYDSVAAELGFFYLLSLIVVFVQLNRVNGDTSRFEYLFSQRKTVIFADLPDVPKKFLSYVAFFTKFYMILPVIVLIWWVVILALSKQTIWVGPASVLIIGLAIPLIVYGFINVHWNYFRFNLGGGISIGFGFLLFLIYQVIVIFRGDKLDLGSVSAFFLGLNAFFVTIMLYLIYSENSSGLSSLYNKAFPLDQGEPLDPNRETILTEELEAVKNNPNWLVTRHELEDIVTIGQVEQGKDRNVIEKSAIAKYAAMPESKRTGIKGGIFVLSVLFLVIYAAAIWIKNETSMGIVIAVSVLLMDVFAFLLYRTKMISSPAGIALLCVVNRALLIMFRDGHWVYGYMILYILYATAFGYLIAKKHYPFEGEVIFKRNQVSFDQLKDKNAMKKIDDKISIFKSPEVLLFVVTILYFVFILIVKFVIESKVKIEKWKMFGIKEFSKEAMAGLSVFFVFTFFVFFCLWRTMVRRVKCVNRSQLKAIRIGEYLITHQILYDILALVCLIGWGIFFGSALNMGIFTTIIILGSLCILCLTQAVTYLALNDFDYFQDITKLNKKIKAHNAEIDNIYQQKAELQQKLRSGQVFQLEGESTQHVLEVFGPEPITIGPITQQQVDQLVEAQQRNTEQVYQDYLKEIQNDNEIAERKRLAKEEEDRKKKEEQERALQENNNASQLPLKDGDDTLVSQPQANTQNNQPNTEMEGGDEDAENLTQEDRPQQQIQPQASVDIKQVFIDIDIAERQGNYSLIASCKHKEITDWRTTHKGWTSAYLGGDLRPNDYIIINSLACLLISWLIMAIAVSIHIGEWLGLVISMPFLYLSVCVIIGAGVVYQHRQFTKSELAIWGVINLVYLLIGLLYFASKWNLTFWWNLTTEQKTEGKMLSMNNFFICYILMVPSIVHGVMVLLRTGTTPITQFKAVFKAFAGVFVVGLILMIVACFLFIDIVTGVSMVVGMGLLIYFMFQCYLYVTNNFTVEPKYEKINLGLCLVLIVFSTIFSIFSSDLSSFEGISLSMFVNLAIVWLYAMIHFAIDLVQLETRPIFFGAALFPIYKYNPQTQNVEEHYGPVFAWLAGLWLLIVWSYLAAFSVIPPFIGVMLNIAFMQIIIISIVYFMSLSQGVLQALRDVDTNVIKQAWYMTKLTYIKDLSVIKRSQLKTYKEFFTTRFYAKAYLDVLQGEKKFKAEKVSSEYKTQLNTEVSTNFNKQFLLGKLQGKIPLEYNSSSQLDMKGWLNDLDKQVRNKFMKEYEQLVQFTMICVQTMDSIHMANIQASFKFIEENMEILHAMGINIVMPNSGPLKERWQLLQSQVQDLDELEKLGFQKIYLNYIKFLAQQKEELARKQDEEKRLREQRDQEQEEARRQKEEELRRMEEERLQQEEEERRKQEEEDDTLQQLRQQEEELKRQEEEQKRKEEEERQRAQLQLGEIGDELQRKAKEEEIRRQQEEQERQRQEQFRLQQEALRQQQEQQRRQLEEQRRQQQQQQASQIDVNKDISNMPDCLQKYQIIVARAKQGMGKWTDNKFTASNSSLGSITRVFGGNPNWKRLCDKGQNYAIFKDGVTLDDVEQGQLGDCYYLSALTLLSEHDLRNSFVFVDNEHEWRQCGAFCIRFYDAGCEDFVIIDDFYPFKGDQFPFARCKDQTELWCVLMEKAYAKKYGSFEKIEGGLTPMALNDLLKGLPEFITTADEKNHNELYQRILGFHNEGIRLGAGSNDHPEGDSAQSKKGIVQGHAYSVIKLIQIDGNNLIQLRNPWGRTEWKGDWSDNSPLWTTRLRNIVGQAGGRTDVKDDGVFWMNFTDFLSEFDSIYVFRTFDPRIWKTLDLTGEWKGKSSAGVNGGVNAKFNPQWAITLNKPDDGFIILRMKDKINKMQSKHFAILGITANSGRQMNRFGEGDEVIEMQNSKMISSGKKIPFPKNLSYPYKFTMMIANFESGAQGEGGFMFTIASHDQNMNVQKIQ